MFTGKEYEQRKIFRANPGQENALCQQTGGINVNGVCIDKLAYADDIDIIGESREDVIAMTKELVTHGNKVGLEYNNDKTKIMEMTRIRNLQGQ